MYIIIIEDDTKLNPYVSEDERIFYEEDNNTPQLYAPDEYQG